MNVFRTMVDASMDTYLGFRIAIVDCGRFDVRRHARLPLVDVFNRRARMYMRFGDDHEGIVTNLVCAVPMAGSTAAEVLPTQEES